MMATVTAAVVQAGSILFDTGRSLTKVEKYCQDAAQAGAKIVVFPEAFLGGYPKGINFGVHIGSRSPEGREEFRRYHDAAIVIPGDETATLGATAARYGIHLIVGLIEKSSSTLYCSTLIVGPDGGILGKHRKLMPTASERLIWGLGDGSTMPAISTPYGVVGMAICWENYMPLFRAAMYAKNVSLWCAPTVDDRESWRATVRHIAIEGRCFVLSACQFLLRSDCPDDFRPIQGAAPDTVLINGGSVIVSPMGQVLAGPLTDGEGVVVAELDLADVTRGKFDLDVVGHYARPDIFKLVVDERPKRSVIFEEP
jgi:nitrilase